MFKPVHKLTKLSLQQQGIVLHAWLLFVVWHIKISYLPYRLWRDALYKHCEIQDDPTLHLRAIDITRLIEKAGRHHIVKINCLRRCMVQKQILEAHNINSQLSIGVKKEQEKLSAHCWLVVNNHIINDSDDETKRYIELQRIDKNQKDQLDSVKNLI
jgi:hypothetical protein